MVGNHFMVVYNFYHFWVFKHAGEHHPRLNLAGVFTTSKPILLNLPCSSPNERQVSSNFVDKSHGD